MSNPNPTGCSKVLAQMVRDRQVLQAAPQHHDVKHASVQQMKLPFQRLVLSAHFFCDTPCVSRVATHRVGTDPPLVACKVEALPAGPNSEAELLATAAMATTSVTLHDTFTLSPKKVRTLSRAKTLDVRSVSEFAVAVGTCAPAAAKGGYVV